MPGARFRYGLWRPGAMMMVKRPAHLLWQGPAHRVAARLDAPTTALPVLWWRHRWADSRDGDGGSKGLQRARACPQTRQQNRARRQRRGAAFTPGTKTITLRQSGGQRVPTFKLGAKGLTGRRARIKACTEVTDLARCNRAQVHRFRDGHRDEPFPFGTYGMRRFYGANVKSAPDPGAILLQPGPTLAEVRQVLRTQSLPDVLGRRAAQRSQALAILDIDDNEQESDDNVAEPLWRARHPTPISTEVRAPSTLRPTAAPSRPTSTAPSPKKSTSSSLATTLTFSTKGRTRPG